MGLSSEIIPTNGHPLVYAESPEVPGAPTVLVYGHYDVQPADPLELWTSPPFEPTRRDGNLFARGATDDKGQVLTHITSAQAWLEVHGRLPVRLKFLIEGEEEVGSQALEAYIAASASRLACDCVVISDGGKFSRDIPAITYGLRGIAYYEIRVAGPNRDLHSGSFGGSVTNPATTVARILAAMVDRRGKIQIPGFYDDVVPLTERERQQFAALPFDEAEYFAEIGVDGAFGEEGYSALERRWARPTYDVCGLWGGYQGEGAKTVLPAKAGAKFSFRLVPEPVAGEDHRRAAALAARDHAARREGRAAGLPRFAGRDGAVGEPLRGGGRAGDRAGLRPRAGLLPRRRFDPHRRQVPRGPARRRLALGLGPGRRQRPQSQREVLLGRLSSRHQGQRGCGRSWGSSGRHNGWTSHLRRAWIILKGCRSFLPFLTEPHTRGLVQ